jgi:23S rRNA (adenine2030-N6)-methyltransferase
MLSYQHGYHAGNLADVHKHATLASAIALMTQKDKPLTYIETHSGRGLYDLQSTFAQKTGEANAGVLKIDGQDWFGAEHPYQIARRNVQDVYGDSAYPGSPLIAKSLLRSDDLMHLAELHPAECEALKTLMKRRARVYAEDGFTLANRICPPTPRRGLMLIDPSYERSEDYQQMPGFLHHICNKWNVGIAILWYPILRGLRHQSMVGQLTRFFPEAVNHEVRFPAVRDGHGMVGSGLFMIRAPYGLDRNLAHLTACFEGLT